jgi:hypothetical protein
MEEFQSRVLTVVAQINSRHVSCHMSIFELNPCDIASSTLPSLEVAWSFPFSSLDASVCTAALKRSERGEKKGWCGKSTTARFAVIRRFRHLRSFKIVRVQLRGFKLHILLIEMSDQDKKWLPGNQSKEVNTKKRTIVMLYSRTVCLNPGLSIGKVKRFLSTYWGMFHSRTPKTLSTSHEL